MLTVYIGYDYVLKLHSKNVVMQSPALSAMCPGKVQKPLFYYSEVGVNKQCCKVTSGFQCASSFVHCGTTCLTQFQWSELLYTNYGAFFLPLRSVLFNQHVFGEEHESHFSCCHLWDIPPSAVYNCVCVHLWLTHETECHWDRARIQHDLFTVWEE